MKLNHSQSCALLAVAVVLSFAPVNALAAAAPAAPAAPGKPADAKAAPKEVVIPKSAFVVDPKKGKDPFFPKSERWNPPPPKPVVAVATPGSSVQPPPPPPKKDPYKHFELKGFVGSGDRRVVTISSGLRNYIVMMGESKLASTPEGPFRFKIVRYTENGVVIQVDGEKEEKELKIPAP